MLRNPIIGQYVEALTDPFRIFRTLGEVVPERDAYGEPLFWSGNYSAIFKVRCADGKYYALKCYTRLPRHAAAVYASLGGGTVPYLVPARFLPDVRALGRRSLLSGNFDGVGRRRVAWRPVGSAVP